MAGPKQFPLLAYQPFQLLWKITRTFYLLAKLPVWLLVALVPRLRPNPSWTFQQSVMAKVLKFMVDTNCHVAITETITLAPGKEGDRFVVIKPQGPEHYATAPLKSDTVAPAEIGATWYPKKPESPSDLRTVVLHLHGGAFVMGDGRTASCNFLAKQYLETAGADAVLCPQYRLTGYGRVNPFPAALQDTVTSYLHLTRDLGIPADRIIISGDSAGGSLIIALMRYLDQPDVSLPKPMAAVLGSPWVSPMAALQQSSSEYHSNPKFHSDYLPRSFLVWGAETYTDGVPDAASNPYIEHLHHPFASPVPFFVNIGEVELFEPDLTAWCDAMRSVEGNKEGDGGNMEVNYEKDQAHDSFLSADIVGCHESFIGVMKKVALFIEKNRVSKSRL